MSIANSRLDQSYEELLHARVGGLDLLHWINEGLMTSFFLLVGLEIKREMVEGQLDTWSSRALALIAAFGGVLVPALIFMAVNGPYPENWRQGSSYGNRHRLCARCAVAGWIAGAELT